MDVLAEVERIKYQRMWSQECYRQWSPGEHAVAQFLAGVDWRPGQSVVDLGCGTGRAGLRLAQQGLSVTLLDFCHEAVEPAAAVLPFIDANLWDLPPVSFDWLYCVDVLEHIPPEKIEQTLDGFARVATKGGYLQIALFQDHCGTMIGETLHLTLQPHEWWKEQVAKRWPILSDEDGKDVRGNAGYSKFLIGAPYE